MGHSWKSHQAATTYQPAIRPLDLNNAWFNTPSDPESDALLNSISTVAHETAFDGSNQAAPGSSVPTQTLQFDPDFIALVDRWSMAENIVREKYKVESTRELSQEVRVSRPMLSRYYHNLEHCPRTMPILSSAMP